MSMPKKRRGASPRLCWVVIAWSLTACSSVPPAPVPIDTRHDACANCRMTVSDRKVAAELLAPAEEPRFFDDLGCLRDYLRTHDPVDPNARVFVTDFGTGMFVDARDAVIVTSTSPTPMGSQLVAFSDRAAARRAGHAEGDIKAAAELLGVTLPGGTR